jgi:Sensors of blue-light using FAD
MRRSSCRFQAFHIKELRSLADVIGMVYQLVYGSAATRPFGEAELADMLQTARANNQRLGVSGMLLYYDRSFLQVLEGDRATVEGLYAKITRDLRHGNVMVFCRGEVPEREFGAWSMAFHAPSNAEIARHEAFREIRSLGPGELGSAKVRALFASFRKMTRLEMAV